MNTEKIVTRFAPSPTGPLHIGGARTALFNYLFTRQNNGKFLLRIEDTDKERSEQKYTDMILASLEVLGINYDDISYQSKNTASYKEALEKLIDEGKAYISKEEAKKEGDRAEVIRFKNPNTKITFNDLIRGEITFDTTDLGDFVLAKSLDEPLYHLANVVDDLNTGVNHVIRGEDHISNTPRQILIMEALGGTRPVYAHIPLILAKDKSKLSKRHGAVAVTEYIEEGYLPEAFVNFIAMIGWSPQSRTGEPDPNQEIFSLDELIKTFDLSKVQKGGAVFNIEKLNWLNREYIKKMPADKQLEMVQKYLPEAILSSKQFNVEALKRALPSIIERIDRFHDVATQAVFGEYDCYFTPPNYSKALLKNQDHFEELTLRLDGLSDANFTKETVKNAVWDYAVEKGKGEVLWPMRIALSGKEKSPDPFTIAEVIGKTETLSRLHHANQL